MIHQYKSNGYNIVMDVNSGSIHVVDDIVYRIIPLVERSVGEGTEDDGAIKEAVLKAEGTAFSADELSEAVDEVLALKAEGQSLISKSARRW